MTFCRKGSIIGTLSTLKSHKEKSVNDLDAFFGVYRATACEWLPKKKCKGILVPGKSYCEEHMKLAYRQPEKKTSKKEEIVT